MISDQGSKHAPHVSVIIPALNVEATIGAQLTALSTQEYEGEWEVIVANNGCSDATKSVVQSFADRLPKLEWVDAASRRGINHARNMGARAASGEILLFCDGDDIVGEGWITAMVTALGSADAVGGSLDFSLLNQGRGGGLEVPNSLTQPEFLPSPIGANCGVRREAWAEVDGFDEDLNRGACDEMDFFWRVQLKGRRLVVAEDAVIHYQLRDSMRAVAKKVYRNKRERARLHKRFRSEGHTRRALTVALKNVLWVIGSSPRALTNSDFRRRWLLNASRLAGRFAGSFRYRTLYL